MTRNELIAALEQGETGWELDGWIMAVLENRAELYVTNRLTRSLDASLALLAEVLPGWAWGMDGHDGLPVEARIGRKHSAVWVARGQAPTPAAALLIAILKAMETKS